MKTISRMVCRYIMAAFGVVLLVVTVNVALFLAVVIHYGMKQPDNGYFPISKLAASFVQTADGAYQPDPELDWKTRFEWAMLLDDHGTILWSENLPEELNHNYTIPEVASFSRWYLEDYPVMVYRNDYGLVVAGLPVGSMTRFDFYMDNDILNTLLSNFIPLLLLDAGLVLIICLLLGWHGARPLRKLANGIEQLAEGEPLQLEVTGATAELAEKLNQTSEYLRKQAKVIEQRDTARTNWIAGVSHDIRTPLALIMGYAEQLEHLVPQGSELQRKAVSIRVQSQKIKTLIEDLNLTSKLQYNSQPLRITDIQAGPMLRQCIADFSNGLDEKYNMELLILETAERQILKADKELLTRAIDNLLNNCVRHNPDGCRISIRAETVNQEFICTIRDHGSGYPENMLRILNGAGMQWDSNMPHRFGLHLVRQIIEAHGGKTEFRNEHGAVAVMKLKVSEETDEICGI